MLGDLEIAESHKGEVSQRRHVYMRPYETSIKMAFTFGVAIQSEIMETIGLLHDVLQVHLQ